MVNLRTFITIVGIFFLVTSLTAQIERETSNETAKKFVIGKHLFRSQKFVDSVDAAAKKTVNSAGEQDSPEYSSIPNAPPPPPMEAYDVAVNIHFTVEPDYFIQYVVVDNFTNGIRYGDGIYEYIKIDRSNMERSIFDLDRGELSPKFEAKPPLELTCCYIDQVNRNVIKEIAGYTCYQIILRFKRIPNKLVELYVTEDLKLEYNPIFNNPEVLKKYYPLNVKIYFEGNPDDDYEEFTFTAPIN